MSDRDDEHAAVQRTGAAEQVRDRFEAMPLSMLCVEGEQSRLVAANAAARSFMGLGEDCIGRTLRELIPEFEGQQLFEMWERVRATGEKQIGREWQVLVDVTRTGGLQEIYVDFIATPHVADDGSTVGVNAYSVNVTEQVRLRHVQVGGVNSARWSLGAPAGCG